MFFLSVRRDGMDRNIWKGKWERDMGNADKMNGMEGYEANG